MSQMLKGMVGIKEEKSGLDLGGRMSESFTELGLM